MDDTKYRTSHQGVAAYFLLEAAPLVEVGKDESLGRVYFVFDIPMQLGRRQAKTFFEGQVQVDAVAFYGKLGEIRTKAFEVKNKT